MYNKCLILFFIINSTLFAQKKEFYSFDKITSGKIKSAFIDSNGEFYLIENSTNSDYNLKIIQYNNGNRLAELFHKNTKRIHFDFDIKFSNLNDIQKLITTKVDYIENSNSVRKHLDSISFEKDSIKNELIVRSFSYEKRRKKINILKDFFYIFKDADELIEDKIFIENLKTINFNPYVRSDKLIRFVNVTDNKINSEIIYEKSVKYDYFISLKEKY